MTELLSPENGAVISLLSGPMREFIKKTGDGTLADGLDDRGWDQVYGWIPDKRDRDRDMTSPAHVLFRWRTDRPAAPAALEISETPDFSSPAPLTKGRISWSATDEGTLFSDVYNLKTGTRYYWRVAGPGGSDDVFSFTTEEGIRAIGIPGCANVRDLGGIRTADGGMIRQGLVYRGGAPDSREEVQYRITEEGKKVFLSDLGIKTEIDLRGDVGPSEFSPDDPVNILPIPYDSYLHSENECAHLTREIFETLADPSVYPVYIHCQAGADRTGTVMYYLEAILGMRLDDIIFDFNVSSLSAIDQRHWKTSENINGHIGKIMSDFPGMTVEEALRARLLSIGVTEEIFGRIRGILLEK
ncbi:MAG: tyrosine-protein phosphatase [Clostridia bacterium]|nr:tyrosine-protein phosphatase [Clostridia bacterium]